jgi:hypothetical protein
MPRAKSFVEEVELQGHIIDSLLLPKVLDEILTRGGTYTIKKIDLGKRQVDPSFAKIEIKADGHDQLDDILRAVHEHGALPVDRALLNQSSQKRGRRDAACPGGSAGVRRLK